MTLKQLATYNLCFNPRTREAVSYTHLDVYKRQGRTRTYHATVDLAQPLPLTSDHDLGPDGPRLGRRPEDIRLPDAEGKVWAALQVSLTLTGDIS